MIKLLFLYITNKSNYEQNKSILIANGYRRKGLHYTKAHSDHFSTIFDLKDVIINSQDQIIQSLQWYNSVVKAYFSSKGKVL